MLRYSLYFFSISIAKALFLHNMWMNLTRVGISIRHAYTMIIFSKSLMLGQKEKMEFSLGRVQNLMSTDCSRIVDVVPMMHMWTWSVAIKLVVPCFFLWHLVGQAFVVGIVVIIVVMPINLIVARRKLKACETDMLKFSDKRIKILSEVIKAVQTVKTLAWEASAIQWVGEIRKGELNSLFWLNLWACVLVCGLIFTSVAMPIATFGYYTHDHRLSLSTGFAALAWLLMLRNALQQLPNVYQQIVTTSVSFDRIQSFMRVQDAPGPGALPRGSATTPVASFKAANLTWAEEVPAEKDSGGDTASVADLDSQGTINATNGDSDSTERLRKLVEAKKKNAKTKRKKGRTIKSDVPEVTTKPALSDVTMDIPGGRLTVVIGETGSGKTTLVSALSRGEVGLKPAEVKVRADAKIGLAVQEPWLQSGTVRSNILMGREHRRDAYAAALSMCSLHHDMEGWKLRDRSKVGEHGVKLSGGQRARIAIARACYDLDLDLYIFDDSFAALDSIVGERVFRKVVLEHLEGKTRVVVTNDPRWVAQADTIVFMDQGTVAYCGPRSEIEQTEHFTSSDFLRAMLAIDTHAAGRLGTGTLHTMDGGGGDNDDGGADDDDDEEEPEERGNVSRLVYNKYLRLFGGWKAVIWMLIVLPGCMVTRIMFDGWFSIWLDAQANAAGAGERWGYYLGVYTALGMMTMFFSALRFCTWAFGGLAASKHLHDDMVMNVLGSPMSFFWLTVSGKIINRFTSDCSQVDRSVPWRIGGFAWVVSMFLQSMVVVCYASWKFMLCVNCRPNHGVYLSLALSLLFQLSVSPPCQPAARVVNVSMAHDCALLGLFIWATSSCSAAVVIIGVYLLLGYFCKDPL